MRDFYELADGSSKLLNLRKQYDLNPNSPIAKKIIKKKPKNYKRSDYFCRFKRYKDI